MDSQLDKTFGAKKPHKRFFLAPVFSSSLILSCDWLGNTHPLYLWPCCVIFFWLFGSFSRVLAQYIFEVRKTFSNFWANSSFIFLRIEKKTIKHEQERNPNFDFFSTNRSKILPPWKLILIWVIQWAHKICRYANFLLPTSRQLAKENVLLPKLSNLKSPLPNNEFSRWL